MDTQQNDDILWKLAKRRAGFKYSLTAYIIVNLFLVGVWFFTTGVGSYFWPAWTAFGWGIGIAFQYFSAYHAKSIYSAEAEYEKLKKQEQKNN